MSAKRKSLTSDQTDRLNAEDSTISLSGLARFVKGNPISTAKVLAFLLAGYTALLMLTAVCCIIGGV